ncbi:hypothetical protein [Cellulomonas sp.]|uniref:hypothetical protein n=1 Tax=Cellulomonas sp. TaxID=40001 RepID=UPI002810AB4A|nr:hypothetical protein [Cellulomonas sp.]
MPHSDRRGAVLAWSGACLVVLALAVGALLLLQPWASCPDDSAPAACPVPADDVPLHAAGWVGAGVTGVVGLALVARPGSMRRR